MMHQNKPAPNTACTRPRHEHAGQAGGSLRVFKQFAWLQVGSGKMALSRPTHQRVTQAVGTHLQNSDIVLSVKIRDSQLK
jgi:hypothetical protein